MKILQTIDETQIHEIWSRQDFLNNLETFNGEIIYVLNPGNYNKDSSGPDFKNARIKIGNLTFVGDIEIDPDYSDWKNHGHNINRHYNKVILHVCLTNSQKHEYVYTSEGRKINSVCIKENIAQDNLVAKVSLAGKFRKIKKHNLKCSSEIENVDYEFRRKHVLNMGMQRFKNKCERLFRRLKELKFISELKLKEPVIRFELTKEFDKREFIHSDFHEKNFWNQLFYEFAFEALGYSKNKNIMLKLSQSANLEFLSKYKNSESYQLVLQSLLFNISGLMPQLQTEVSKNSDYINSLSDIWNELSAEYDGKKFDETQWHFLGQRPQNFPTIRIAGGAYILYSLISQNLIPVILQKFSELDSIKLLISTIRSLFIIKAKGYWRDHYIFEKKAVNRINYLIGLSRADEIFINVLLPYLFIYYEIFGNKELSKKVLKVFNEYEQNSVNRLVKEVSDDLRLHRINSKAIYSQGVIELYRNLCSKNKCMECAIGQKVFN